jgi:LDH2 family malate/lactate/ureidoglycolate dehydrogenase
MTDSFVPVAEARSYISRTLEAAGLEAAQAEAAAEIMTEANIRGIDGHGIMRIPQYVTCLGSGIIRAKPNVTTDRLGGPFALVDADGGYGFLPSLLAVELADELTEEHGVAIVAVRNSHHFGYAGGYVDRLARKGKIAFLATNGQPLLVPPGGSKPVTGNNPIAFGIPREGGGQPIVLDMALSKSSFGKIRWAAKEDQPLPPGLAYDRQGNPTTDAREALAAEALAQVGDHKGYGLSFVVEVLAGILTGSPFGQTSDSHGNVDGGVGHLFLTFDPERLRDLGGFFGGVEELIEQVKAAGSVDSPVYFPGEPELIASAERLSSGIPVAPGLRRELRDVSAELGVALPPQLD